MEYNTIGYYEPQRHLNKSPSESYVTRTVPGSKEGLDEEEPKSKDGGLLITGDRCSPSEGVVSAEVSDEVQNNYASGDNPSHDEVSSMRSESSQKPSVHALTPNDSKFCRQLLESLKRHSCSWPFAAPVDPVAAQAPDYFDVIKHPMDLSTIESKFMSGEYKSPKDFLSEVRLMLNNCFTYNPPTNIVYQHGKSLEIHLNLQISKLFPSLIAGDDPDLSGDGSPDLNDPRRRSRRVVKPSRKTDPTGKRSQAQDTEGGASGLAGAKSIPKSAESADLPEELLDGSGRGGSTENAEEERHNEEEEYKREEGLEPLNDIDSAMDVSIYPGTFDRIEDDYSHRRRRRRHLQDNNRRKYQYDTYTEMDNHTIPKSDHSLYEKDQDNEFGEYGDESGASDWEYIRDIKSTLMSCLKTVNIHIALLAKRKRRKSSHKISQNFYPYKAQKYAKKIKRKGRKEYGGKKYYSELRSDRKGGSMDFKNCMSPDSINTYTRLNQDGSKKYCEYCGTSETPMWRRGPSGCGTLCNKCGVKWRSGKIMDSVLNSDFLRYKQNFENDFEDKESKQSNPPVNESADKESSDNEDNDQQSSKTNVAYSKGPLTENGAKESKEAPENQNSKNSEQRAITYEQKRELSVLIDQLPDEYMYQAADIIRSKLPHLKDIYEDIELDIDTVDETVLVALYDFVTSVTRKKNDNEKSSVVYDTADKNDKAAKGQDTAPNGVAVSDNMVVEKLRADDAIIQESAILSENKGQAESINPVIVGALE